MLHRHMTHAISLTAHWSELVARNAHEMLGEQHYSCLSWSQNLGFLLPRGDASTLSPWDDLVWQPFRVRGGVLGSIRTLNVAKLQCQADGSGIFFFKQHKLPFLRWLLCVRLYYFYYFHPICQARRIVAMLQNGDWAWVCSVYTPLVRKVGAWGKHGRSRRWREGPGRLWKGES